MQFLKTARNYSKLKLVTRVNAHLNKCYSVSRIMCISEVRTHTKATAAKQIQLTEVTPLKRATCTLVFTWQYVCVKKSVFPGTFLCILWDRKWDKFFLSLESNLLVMSSKGVHIFYPIILLWGNYAKEIIKYVLKNKIKRYSALHYFK